MLTKQDTINNGLVTVSRKHTNNITPGAAVAGVEAVRNKYIKETMMSV
jgi:hypothetical protein